MLSKTQANTSYKYQIGANTPFPSAVHHFTTLPPVGELTKLAVIGDLGVENANGTVDALRYGLSKGLFTSIVHLGDISYADDHDLDSSNPGYEGIMNSFFEMVEPVASAVPYLTLPGNHDVTCKITTDDMCPSYLRNFTAYNARWRMPAAASGSESNLWYSTDVGNVHLTVINTETDLPHAPYTPTEGTVRAGGFGDQMAWLRKDLEAAKRNRALVPWLVVMGHRPLYSSSTLDYPSDQQNRTRADLESLLTEFGVDLYISGHVHLAERTLPMRDFKATQDDYHNPSAPVYVINGAAGNMEGHCEHVFPTLPSYMPWRNKEIYGYGIISSFNGNPTESDKTRVEGRGDFNGVKGVNVAPAPEVVEAYMQRMQNLGQAHKMSKMEAIMRLSKMSQDNAFTRLVADLDKSKSKCQTARSLCYDFMPAFIDDRYVDRICITRCDE
jgi:hypothetical protein